MKVLLIGFGSIGRRHRDILFDLIPDTIVDIVSSHANGGEAQFPSLAQVPDLDRYDYFLVCSETSAHLSTLKMLNAKVHGKRILVEKPVFMAPLTEPLELHNDVFVGYNLRYHPVLERIRELLISRHPLVVSAMAGQYLPGWRPSVDQIGRAHV
mgnify:CR=1 FL=1